MCSFLNNLFTGNNNTMYSKKKIGNRNFHSKLPIIVFQINSISSIESEEFRETSIVIQTISKKKLKIIWNNLSVLLSILLVKHARIEHC